MTRSGRSQKQAPRQITLTFELIGNEDERRAQYEWLKRLEKTTLGVYMQSLYQCNAPGESYSEPAQSAGATK